MNAVRRGAGFATLQVVAAMSFMRSAVAAPPTPEIGPPAGTVLTSDLQNKIPEPVLVGAVPPTGVFVAPMRTVPEANGGEIQSAVVPPGVSAFCPSGRILVTNDYNLRGSPDIAHRPNVMVGYDLPMWTLSGAATFENPFPTDPAKAPFATGIGQDHNIVVLKNGDVLLVVMGGINDPSHIAYPDAAHDWFNWSYVGDGGLPGKIVGGPGLRVGAYVWRSTDCGTNFKWMGEIDPANLGDGSCAMPQIGRVPAYYVDASGNYSDATGTWYDAKTPGATFKGYNQGGTDGPLVIVDPRDDSVWVTFGCAGNFNDLNSSLPYGLGAALNKTAVFRSTDHGASWQQAGELPTYLWRGSIVPLAKDRIAFYANGQAIIYTVKKNGGTVLNLDATTPPLPNLNWWPGDKVPPLPDVCIAGNVLSSAFVARGPVVGGSQTLLFTYPTMPSTYPSGSDITKAKKVKWGQAQDLILYDPATQKATALPPVAPSSHSPNDAVIHLTAIDLGSGPLLLYWVETSQASATATIRGRLVNINGTVSKDFQIARTAAASAATTGYNWKPRCNYKEMPKPCTGWPPHCPPGTLTVKKPAPDFYGDYHTASGFVAVGGTPQLKTTEFHYFPLWIEPGVGGRVAEVVVTYGPHKTSPDAWSDPSGKIIAFTPPLLKTWRSPGPPATLAVIARSHGISEQDVKAERERERRKAAIKPGAVPRHR